MLLQEGGSRTPRRFSIAIMSASLAATDDNNSIPLFRSFAIASAKLFNASVIFIASVSPLSETAKAGAIRRAVPTSTPLASLFSAPKVAPQIRDTK
ncbi:hypothetical protein [Mesorhizobium retamae]|uniref:Uncharacterized protein n=1 Tax=Mesorhizobium retamae TaxID=2912854 RepID=A0ABS9QCF0_9HYPH|nr:hypothetical protein [Mesorhizobium sp. IRAMC:0171]MCG7505096.1 hypothetical protein [Mesorhizobium sp. IRAMC:0171]